MTLPDQDILTSMSTLDLSVSQNKEEAFECYQKGADLGDSEACNCLGLMLESGFDK
jgi:TPR repeat protein